MPCNFAGMAGGCKYHQCKFVANDLNWIVPLFSLTKPDSPRIDEQAEIPEELPELFPFYNGAEWSLQLEGGGFNKHFEYAVRRFIEGFDDSDNERSEK